MSSRFSIWLAVLAFIGVTVPGVANAQTGQVFGTFSWQMLPYCHIVTLTLKNTPAGFTLDGSEDQCGATNRAAALGVATFNATGLVTLSFTIVTAPSGKPVHVSTVVSPADGSGTWTDSYGNSGSFVFFGNTPGLPTRPVPPDIRPGSITSTELAAGAVGAAQIAAGAVGAAQINMAQVQTRVSGVCPPGQAMTGVNADGTVVCGSNMGWTGSKPYFVAISGATEVDLSFFTYTAPMTGVAVFRTRGSCEVTRQSGTSNEVQIGIVLPTETVAGTAANFERTGVVRIPALNPADNSASYSLGYSAERVFNVNQGVSYTVDLRAKRVSGTDSGVCRGTFTIDVSPNVIP